MQLESMTIEQLADLRDKVISHLNDRVSAKQKELQAEIERFGSLGSMQKARPVKTAPKAKYRHPTDANLTWSGKGHSPSWVKQYLALGGTMEELKAPQ